MPRRSVLSGPRRADSLRANQPDRDDPASSADSPGRRRHRLRRLARFALVGLVGFAGPAAAGWKVQDIDAIRKTAQSFVAAEIPPTPGTTRTIRIDNLDPRLRLDACPQDLETFFPPGVRGGSNRTVGVHCQGPKPWTVYVTARISYRGQVLVAARGLPRGTVIQASDLVAQERDLQGGPLDYLTQAQQAVGMRTARALRPGMLIDQDSLEEVPVVARGQRVWLIAQSSNLQVRTVGTALQSGTVGAMIRVENTSSGKIVEGVVTRQGVVRISL
jgi:flagellar basal body P-ring formation protein FlgA